jgi:uncharacterized alkaline shock family protein YloU
MGIINRILLFFYTIGIALLSLGIIVLCLQVVPANYAWNEFLYLCGRWETGVAAFVVFLISIELFGLTFAGKAKKTRSDKDALIVHGELGEVKVAVDAIRNLVDRTTRCVHGVRDVKAKVEAQVPKDSPEAAAVVNIELKLVIGQESNVAEVSDEIQKQVKRHLQDFIGIHDFNLNIVIGDISNAAITKQRVM